MREHIFKAKDVNTKEWVYGDLIQDKKNNKCFIASNWLIDQEFICFDCNLNEVDPNTICESTGVTDKNNKMIFEEDIIQNYRFDETSYVNWNKEGLVWELINIKSHGLRKSHNELNEINIEAAWGDTPSYEVVGNIYD